MNTNMSDYGVVIERLARQIEDLEGDEIEYTKRISCYQEELYQTRALRVSLTNARDSLQLNTSDV